MASEESERPENSELAGASIRDQEEQEREQDPEEHRRSRRHQRRQVRRKRALLVLSTVLLVIMAVSLIFIVMQDYGLGAILSLLMVWSLLLYAILGYGGRLWWLGLVVDEHKETNSKTLWEWLDLLVVPALLLVGGVVLNDLAQHRASKTNDKVQELIEQDRSEQTALQSYLDNLTKLMMDEGLGSSDPEAPERVVAGAQTLTVLQGLSPERKRIVVQFLHKSGLIHNDDTKVDLSGANLDRADLRNLALADAELDDLSLKSADLRGARLQGANLASSNLRGATLIHANLRHADLHGTNLRNAHLEKADLRGAAMRGVKLHGAHLQDSKGTTTREP